LIIVVIVTARLLGGLLAGRSVVNIRPGRTASVRGRWPPTITRTAIRQVILVVDNGYDDGFVAAVLVLQQPVNDPVYVAVRVGAAGLQRYSVWSVIVALFIRISRC